MLPIPVATHGDETGRQTGTDHRILLTRHPRNAVADLIPKSRDFR